MIQLVQGDTLNLTITVEAGAELIEELWLTSRALNISEKLTQVDDTHWLAVLNPSFTCNCKGGYTTYDVTAILKDNQVSTLVFNGEIKVLEKENAINGKYSTK